MRKKLLLIFTFLLLSVCFCTTAYAHSGRTDSNGGHYNRETGEYHYHHGYPAHDHDGGVCPYDYDDRTGWNSGTSTKTKKPTYSDSSWSSSSYSSSGIYKKNDSWKYWAAGGGVCAILLGVSCYKDKKRQEEEARQKAAEEKARQEQFNKEREKYMELYGGRKMSEIVSAPDYALIDSHGLPKDRDATTYWGKHFTVYCSATGKRAHRKKGCSNAHIAKNIVNAPGEPCSRCFKGEKEPLGWFYEYRNIKNLAKKYDFFIFDDLKEEN